MQIAEFPRLNLAHLPTPLERLDNLSKMLGVELWIKRDDCTGLSTGGNKARKLEFLIAEALERDADIVITHGATQSNHARQTAAAAARTGLACHVLLEDRTGKPEPEYRCNGIVFLDRLHGATIESRPSGLDMNAELDGVAARLRAEGRKPYVIPGGGSNPTGALGYVNTAMELVFQADAIGLRIDHVVHATGSAGTQAGMVVELAGMDTGIRLLGIGVRAPKDVQERNVYHLARDTARKLGMNEPIGPELVEANCDYVGAGYGLPGADTLDAIRVMACTEGILLDPVYSGKAMAGLLDLCRQGAFESGETIVFLHTGGSAALFGYTMSFNPTDDDVALPAHVRQQERET